MTSFNALAILACDGTFGKHPTTFTDHASVVLLHKLEKEGVDVSLSRGGIGFQDLVRFDITPDVLEKRVPKKDELKKKLAAIPTEALYGFQRVAVELVCQSYISGRPGATHVRRCLTGQNLQDRTQTREEPTGTHGTRARHTATRARG